MYELTQRIDTFSGLPSVGTLGPGEIPNRNNASFHNASFLNTIKPQPTNKQPPLAPLKSSLPTMTSMNTSNRIVVTDTTTGKTPVGATTANAANTGTNTTAIAGAGKSSKSQLPAPAPASEPTPRASSFLEKLLTKSAQVSHEWPVVYVIAVLHRHIVLHCVVLYCIVLYCLFYIIVDHFYVISTHSSSSLLLFPFLILLVFGANERV